MLHNYWRRIEIDKNYRDKSLTLSMLIPDIILLLLVYIKLKRKSVKHNNHK